jgi:flagellin
LYIDNNIGAAIASFIAVDSANGDATSATAIASLAGSGSFDGSQIDKIEKEVNKSLLKIGNLVQRLDAKDEFLTVAVANATATVSRLFDADMAMEQLNATKGSILQQAATAMLSQLNSAPQQVMQLFR